MKLYSTAMNVVGRFYSSNNAASELKELQEDYKQVSTNMPGSIIDKTGILHKRYGHIIEQVYFYNVLQELKIIKSILLAFVVLMALGAIVFFVLLLQQL